MAGQGGFWVANNVPGTHALLLPGLPGTQRRDGKTPAFLSSLQGRGIIPALPGQRGDRDSEVAATTITTTPHCVQCIPLEPHNSEGRRGGQGASPREKWGKGGPEESMLGQCHTELEVAPLGDELTFSARTGGLGSPPAPHPWPGFFMRPPLAAPDSRQSCPSGQKQPPRRRSWWRSHLPPAPSASAEPSTRMSSVLSPHPHPAPGHFFRKERSAPGGSCPL